MCVGENLHEHSVGNMAYDIAGDGYDEYYQVYLHNDPGLWADRCEIGSVTLGLLDLIHIPYLYKNDLYI